ncbi:MAG: hydroxymethylpyrimidine/phosphomethylpyrimidine kinase [Gammaproteobacteria bacterium]|nr:hydroxymethylpyrimidine/phosphomethylpyrimidine kinase [Gammaproteobacteria bacterium]
MDKKKIPSVLVIAGNDPSGGAGLAADIQAISATGAHPAPVVTSLTVQDTINAYEIEPVEPFFVRFQAETVLKDLNIKAIKLGLLATAEIGMEVARLLAKIPEIPVVADPVLVAAGGARLAEERLLEVYLHEILPRATVLTPNAEEIRALAPGENSQSARATRLLSTGCQYVLCKGGDEDTPEVENTLYKRDGQHRSWRWERVPGSHHGSGCTLASAIASFLAQGESMERAVKHAQQFTQEAIARGFKPGRGQDVPWRSWPLRAQQD